MEGSSVTCRSPLLGEFMGIKRYFRQIKQSFDVSAKWPDKALTELNDNA